MIKESKTYDCSRGCSVERTENGELDCNYRPGCCKLEVYDWLSGVNQEQYKEFFEVRFKNTRKGIYRNASGQSIKMGDMVIVEGSVYIKEWTDRNGVKRHEPEIQVRDLNFCGKSESNTADVPFQPMDDDSDELPF